MKYLLLLIFLTSCYNIDKSTYKNKVEEYCAPCGGVNAAFLTEDGQNITCRDGTALTQKWVHIPDVILLGKCK